MTEFRPFPDLTPPTHPKTSPGRPCEANRVVIIGAGLAGLFAALKLSESGSWPVVLLSPAKLGAGSASSWAQGGIAAAVGPDDSVGLHVRDTVGVGVGLNDRAVVEAICQSAPTYIDELNSYGVAFDWLESPPDSPNESVTGQNVKEKVSEKIKEKTEKDATGQAEVLLKGRRPMYALSREAAHSANRIVRCTGDSSGRMIMESLIAQVERQPLITVLEGVSAHRLLQDANGQVCGVSYHHLARPAGWEQNEQANSDAVSPGEERVGSFAAKVVILACGGIGSLFEASTNPQSAQGQGLGMAALAGAVLADSEFVQFHPTALDLEERPRPLASETLRGEGATLLDAAGKCFMQEGDSALAGAELAPRDIVARAVFRARRESGGAYLDCRHLCGDSVTFSRRFPTLWQSVQRHGLNPHRDLLPVIPAAHYHMGGVATDLRARSSVPGLWAIGEVACTGFHGANRLASNSLLEAMVMAGNAAEDILGRIETWSVDAVNNSPESTLAAELADGKSGRSFAADPTEQADTDIGRQAGAESPESPTLQELMSRYVGVDRSTEGLITALKGILRHAPQSLFMDVVMNDPADSEGFRGLKSRSVSRNNALVAALFIACAALLRSESRGSHYYLSSARSSVSVSPELQTLLDQYCSNGRRSFLDWSGVCRILNVLRDC
ncbi:FAD-dependent oxidoreductase [Candidatus Haliotispira prima]|uniref:L-aspartate oxidase n=1 Tax=Candidatus Haliotispira prima TaxID=3034016 RepID=A0ABY8MMM9_9SPIO|nr:FAD-dependent oxidoreductase [Candidatus Haliotispira prima]